MNAIIVTGLIVISISAALMGMLSSTISSEMIKYPGIYSARPSFIFGMYMIGTFIAVDLAAVYVMFKLRH
jgi:hypothetical protein